MEPASRPRRDFLKKAVAASVFSSVAGPASAQLRLPARGDDAASAGRGPALDARGHNAFRPPAVPLVAHDPFFSCWAMGDKLYGDWPKHWTESPLGLNGLIRIDGRVSRFLGNYAAVPETLEQVRVDVTATRTIYRFTGRGVGLVVTFCSPLLTDDLDVMSRPATYVTFDVASTDGRPHDVQLLFEASGEWAVNTPDVPITLARRDTAGLRVTSLGASKPAVLKRSGDMIRIDWGHLLLACPKAGAASVIARAEPNRQSFLKTGKPLTGDLGGDSRRVDDEWPVLAVGFDLGNVAGDLVSRRVILAYDDEYALQYFGKNVRAWWRRDEATTAETMLQRADADYEDLMRRCVAFDEKLFADARAAGGEKFARLCGLAYRQCIAAHKLAADTDGTPILVSKENSSNGCAGTVDVTYPSAPFFLLFEPQLLEAQLVPVLRYADSGKWPFDFGPHDVGQYPLVNGNVYGDNKLEFQMPVEESGNLLILLAALGQFHDTRLAAKHWPTLTKWADYLVKNGLDPTNQLCTADMFGHMAHNADLSLKAILGIGGYAQLCDRLGKKADAQKYMAVAKDYAARWQKMAGETGPTRLAFDRPGTWGMKHNLIWDRVLKLGLFPAGVGDREIEHYLRVQNAFGLPCDDRTPTTLLDWAVWCASLAPSPADFEALVAPLYRAANETTNRVPLTDWYDTVTSKNSGFRARSVVGGIYMKQLVDRVRSGE